MKTLYTLLISLASVGLFVSCGSDSNECDDYSGPALKKSSGGGCYYDDNGTTVSFTSPEACKCAK